MLFFKKAYKFIKDKVLALLSKRSANARMERANDRLKDMIQDMMGRDEFSSSEEDYTADEVRIAYDFLYDNADYMDGHLTMRLGHKPSVAEKRHFRFKLLLRATALADLEEVLRRRNTTVPPDLFWRVVYGNETAENESYEAINRGWEPGEGLGTA